MFASTASAAANIFGTIPGWLTVIGVAVTAFVFRRGGGGTALASLETANRILEKRVHQLEEGRAQDKATIAELQAKTDISVALQPLVEWSRTNDARFMAWSEAHEQRAQERHVATLEVLHDIANKVA